MNSETLEVVPRNNQVTTMIYHKFIPWTVHQHNKNEDTNGKFKTNVEEFFGTCYPKYDFYDQKLLLSTILGAFEN